MRFRGEPEKHNRNKSAEKSLEKLQHSTREFNDTSDLFKSTPMSLRSAPMLKGMSAEALCQSIELLKLEIKDVKDRDKSQDGVYEKIMSYMHKSELSHLTKRFETQIEMKDRHIETVEEKLKEFKAKCRDLENRLTDKTNEFEYYVKEEKIRMQELEFKLKSQNDKPQVYTPPENTLANLENTLRKEFEKDKQRQTQEYNDILEELKEVFNEERLEYKTKIDKLEDTIKRLTQKLKDLKDLKDKQKLELTQKLKQPCKKCQNYHKLVEEIEAIKMEREDAYHKIQNLEHEVLNLRQKIEYDEAKHIHDQTEMDYYNKQPEETEVEESYEINITSEQPTKETFHDPQVYQKYREFQKKFVKEDKAQKLAAKTEGDSKDEMKDMSTYQKATDNYVIEEVDEKSSVNDERYRNARQETKGVPLSTISSSFKNNTHSMKMKDWSEGEILLQNFTNNGLSNTRNDRSIYNDQNVNIDKLIEKYIGPKPLNRSKDLDAPKKIMTKEDLVDFNKKYIQDKTLSIRESKEESYDPSLILFGSVNKYNDTPGSQLTTVKHQTHANDLASVRKSLFSSGTKLDDSKFFSLTKSSH